MFVESLIVSGLVILFKILSIWFTIAVLNIPFELVPTQSVIPYSISVTGNFSIAQVTAWSNLFFSVLVIISGVYIIAKGIVFSKEHVHPKTMTKLVELNLMHILEEKAELLPRLLVWNIYLWLVSVLIVRDLISNSAFVVPSVVLFILTLVFSFTSLMLFEREIPNVISDPTKNGKRSSK